LLDTLQLFFNGHWVEAFCRGDTGSVSDPKQKIAPLKRHTEDALTGQIWGQLDASSHEGLAKFDRVYVSVLDILPASRLLIKKADRVKVQRRIMQKLNDPNEPFNVYAHQSNRSIGFLDIGLPKARLFRVIVLLLAPFGVHLFLHNLLCYHSFELNQLVLMACVMLLLTVAYYWGAVGAVIKLARKPKLGKTVRA